MQSDNAIFRIDSANTCGVLAIWIECASKRLSAFADFFDQSSFENAQPILIRKHFVITIHNCYGVF